MFQHLKDVCMSYFDHMYFSLFLCITFAIGSYKAFVHALIPSLFITSSSDLIKEVAEKMKTIGCRNEENG